MNDSSKPFADTSLDNTSAAAAASRTYQSLSGVIRVELDLIEQKIHAGIPRIAIFQEYKDRNFVGTYEAFLKALTRARKFAGSVPPRRSLISPPQADADQKHGTALTPSSIRSDTTVQGTADGADQDQLADLGTIKAGLEQQKERARELAAGFPLGEDGFPDYFAASKIFK